MRVNPKQFLGLKRLFECNFGYSNISYRSMQASISVMARTVKALIPHVNINCSKLGNEHNRFYMHSYV